MSFQGFQGDLGTVGGGSSPSAQAHLTATQKRIAELKAQQEAAKAAAALNNRTSTGLILDTNKAAGGATNIPNSQYVIIGGKAVSKDNIGRNITSTRPSILTKNGRVYADSPNLTDAQKQALGIFTAEHAVTNKIANDFSSERRAQQLSGKSIAEANEIAKGIQTNPLNYSTYQDRQIGITNREKNIVNTALQTDIIRSNAAKLNFAEELIKNQTDTNRSLDGNITSELDDLETLLKSAPNQDQPINKINVQGDEFGNFVSPRNVKLQIENAGFTGGLTDPTLNIIGSQGTMPKAEEVAQLIDSSFADVLDNPDIRGLTSTTVLPDGTVQVDFAEGTPDFLRQQFGDTVYDVLGRYFDLKDQGVDDFFSNPDGLRLKFGEEEVQVGGSGGGSGGFASELLDGQGFDILGFLTNPIVLIVIVAIVGFIMFAKFGGKTASNLGAKQLVTV